MTKICTELNTLAEINGAAAEGKKIEFLSDTGVWLPISSRRNARRYRLVEEAEEVRPLEFGDKIVVWDFYDHGRKRKFVHFNNSGSAVVLNSKGDGITSYIHWRWPDEAQND